MKIAIFGGAFDPFHLGHQQVVDNLLLKKMVDEVWLVPVGRHAFAKRLSSNRHRLAMLQLGKEQLSWSRQKKVQIVDCELRQMKTNHTLSTLRYFRKNFPNHQFIFLMGSDNVADFHRWHHYQELLKQFEVWVYPRQNFPFQPIYPQMTFLPQMPTINISATLVRERRKKGLAIAALVGDKINQYISKHHLYAE